MRILLTVVLVAAAGWSAFWWLGSLREERAIATWLDERASDGWVAEYADVETKGFPNRFDTTISGIDLADPATGVAWSAPFLQLFRLSYEANHFIVVWPELQTIASPHQRIEIETVNAKGSFVFVGGGQYQPERISLASERVNLSSNAGWTASMENGRLATRPSERFPGFTDFALDARNVRPASPALAALADAGLVPGALEYVSLDASLEFDRVLDRTAIESSRPNPTRIEIKKFQSKWGELELWLAGSVNVGPGGTLSGDVTVKAKNWREILTIATATGWIPDPLSDPLESGLTLLSTLSGSTKTLDVPLTIINGQMSLGPIPLGQAPKVRIR